MTCVKTRKNFLDGKGEIFSEECCKKGDSWSWEARSTQDETACVAGLESLVTSNRNVQKETKC